MSIPATQDLKEYLTAAGILAITLTIRRNAQRMHRPDLRLWADELKLSDLVGSLCFVACFLSMVFQLMGGSLQFGLRAVAVASAVILVIVLLIKGLINYKVVIAGVTVFIFILFDAYIIGAKELLALMQMVVAMVMGLFLVRCRLMIGPARILFWIIVSSMAYLYSISPDHYEIFPTQGRNFCGAYALLAFFVLAVAIAQREKRVTNELLVAAFACLALSVYTVGRGSILSCALLVALLIAFKYRDQKNSSYRALFISIVLIVAISSLALVMLFNADVLSQILSRFGSVSADRSNATRTTLYLDYLKNIFSDREALLFGINPMKIMNETIFVTGGNLHCSYLQWHANFGILGLALLILFSLTGLRDLWLNGNYVLCAACISILFRALTDTMLVGGIWDIVFFYLSFYVILKISTRVDGPCAQSLTPIAKATKG